MAKSLCLDFDGVIYCEPTGTVVAGAVEFITEAVKVFDVSIFSTRSMSNQGIESMVTFLAQAGLSLATLEEISFPTYKPPAYIFVDDRAINFSGTFPSMEELDQFRGWQERLVKGVLDGKKT